MTKFRRAFRSDINFSILILVTIGIMIWMGIALGDKMYNERNFTSMMFQMAEFGMMCLGMGLTMLLGGIDLSIVANANLAGVIASFIMTNTGLVESMGDGVIPIAVIIAMLLATVCGLLNGTLIAKFSINPIVTTLGTMILFNGIGMAMTGGKGVTGFSSAFTQLGVAQVGAFPVTFILFAISAVVIIFLMSMTSFGKKVYMIGENHVAARFSAINNEKDIMIIYALSGLMAGIAGIMIIARVNSGKMGYGDTYLMQAILVCVLGGISPSGGKGKILGIVIALFAIQVLQSSFNMWQITPYAKNMIWGLMLIGLIFLNKLVESMDLRRQKQLLHEQLAQKKAIDNAIGNG